MRGFSLGVRLLPAVYSSLPRTSLILCVKIGVKKVSRCFTPSSGPFYLRSVSQSVSWPICCSQGLFLDICMTLAITTDVKSDDHN